MKSDSFVLGCRYTGPLIPEGDLISILRGYKLTCPLLQREAPSLHSKVVHYINIFEKRYSRTKAVSVSTCKMYRMQKTYRDLFFQQQVASLIDYENEKKKYVLEGVAKNPEGKDTTLKDNELESHSQGESQKWSGELFQGRKTEPLAGNSFYSWRRGSWQHVPSCVSKLFWTGDF